MKLYEGVRTPQGCIATANGKPLDLRLDIRAHSPTGVEWGYAGSGPAQLALAILADAMGDEVAREHYQQFKHQIVAGFEWEGWIVTQAEIRCWIASVLGGTGHPSGEHS
jgi:hypothetical protein